MKNYLTWIAIFSLMHSQLPAEPIDINEAAPQVLCLNDTGKEIDLGKELSSGIALVFFYPKAMTPGCTKQACSLRDHWDDLKSRNVKIFGVSSDTVQAQSKFKAKYNFPFTLVADTDGAVSRAFGKGRRGRHAYIFIDGKLAWRDLKASTQEQAKDVLKALDRLNQGVPE